MKITKMVLETQTIFTKSISEILKRLKTYEYEGQNVTCIDCHDLTHTTQHHVTDLHNTMTVTCGVWNEILMSDVLEELRVMFYCHICNGNEAERRKQTSSH